MPFQFFDLVAVRIFHNEKLRHQGAIAMKFFDVLGRQAKIPHARVFGGAIIDTNRHVAVSVAMRVGLGAILVECKFNLEIGLILYAGKPA
jgi:hypothetical protein